MSGQWSFGCSQKNHVDKQSSDRRTVVIESNNFAVDLTPNQQPQPWRQVTGGGTFQKNFNLDAGYANNTHAHLSNQTVIIVNIISFVF